MTPKRDHFIEFVHHNVTTIKNHPILPTLSMGLLLLGTGDSERLVNIGFILLCVLIIGHSFLIWYNKRYEFQQGAFFYTHGVFHRTYNHVPFQNIKSIYLTDTWFKRLMGLSNLHIELLGGEKIHFVLKNKEIYELRKTIFHEWFFEQKTENNNRFRPFEYFLLSTTNFPLILAGWSLTLTSLSFVLKHFSVLLGLETAKEHEQSIQDTRGLLERLSSEGLLQLDFHFWIPLIILIGVTGIIAMLFTFVMSMITYRGFSLQKRVTEYEVSYGLLNRNQYVLPLKDVRSLRIVEPMWFRLFGYVQVKMDHIGLNERAAKQLYVAPILKKAQLNAYFSEWFPQFSIDEKIESPERKSLVLFLWKKPLIWTVIITILGSQWSLFLFGYAILPFLLLYGYLEWKHEGLGFNDNFIMSRNVERFTIVTIVTPVKHVESTSFAQAFWSKKRGYGSYSFALYSEKLEEVYTCTGISDERQKEFLNYLIERTP